MAKAEKKATSKSKTTRKSTASKETASKTTQKRAQTREARATAHPDVAGKALVIVESPTKAKTLKKYLGNDYHVEASAGHVKDLPEHTLGVNIEDNFRPEYVVLPDKEKVLAQIRADAKKSSRILLAPDPDREGEAIAWHIAEDLREHGVNQEIRRATFNEITKKAVIEALAHPRDLDQHLFEAQQARRILDRIVGYQISPLLGKKVSRGLSAGRVQSVAVRLIVDREREIRNFQPQEYWVLQADCEASSPPLFIMTLASVDGDKRKLANETEARELLAKLDAEPLTVREADEQSGATPKDAKRILESTKRQVWRVARVERKEVVRRPAPPFITSTLQQEAARKLGFTTRQTMRIAQQLYEGVELGELGQTALITYMRTDSTRLSNEAVQAAREYIERTFGAEYLPPSPNVFEKKKGAQDAHEAIRPTDLSLSPQRVAPYLDKNQKRLYELIWNRFIACQMADARLEQTRVTAEPKEGIVFTVTGSVVKFLGYLAAYEESKDDKENGESSDDRKLPELHEGDEIQVRALRALQKFTQPPPRYTEASLVRELERLGIGRPSTYATIVSTIQDRKYVEKDSSKRFRPTEMGELVTDLLMEHFPDIMDVQFTARMEEELDAVEAARKNWLELLNEFYARFKRQLEAAKQNMREVKREYEETDIVCDKCGQARMIIKMGRNGRFLACPRYPECKNTRDLGGDGTPGAAPESTGELCPNCGRPMIIRSGRFGRFVACSGYPDCKTTKPLSTGVTCPECGTGHLTEAKSKQGKIYWRCSNRKCDFVCFDEPVAGECPQCGAPTLYRQKRYGKSALVCKKCRYRLDESGEDAASDAATPEEEGPASPEPNNDAD